MAFPLFVLISMAIAVATLGAVVLFSDRPRLAAGAGLAGAGLLLIFHGRVFFNSYPVDDAFIAFRYSQHLADGQGPNWNTDGRVEGYTSFLWMALVAGIHKLGPDILDAGRVLIYAALAGTFVAVYLMWRLWSEDAPDSGIERPVVLALSLVLLALTDGLAYWGFSGLETPLTMFLLTFGAYLILRERRSGGPPWSALAFVAAALTRPEGAAAGLVTGAFLMGAALASAERRKGLVRALLWLAIFGALYGAYFFWRYEYYGYLLPNTAYAKVGATGAILERGAGYVTGALLKYNLLVVAGGMAALLAVRRLRWDAAYLLVLCSALLGVVIIEGGDSFGHNRFIVPLLPIMYLAGIAGLATVVQRLSFNKTATAIACTAIAAVAALVLIGGSNNPFLDEDRENHAERKAIGRWLAEHTPEHYTIAAYAVGAVAYYAERDMLDLLGLNDVVIAHTDIPNFGSGIAGHEKYNADYVLGEVRPEIIVTNDADTGPLTTSEYYAIQDPRRDLPARAALVTDPRLWRDYEIRSLNVDGYWFNFLQRKDTISELQAPGLR
jgi:arabinofuranosyltransferase